MLLFAVLDGIAHDLIQKCEKFFIAGENLFLIFSLLLRGEFIEFVNKCP